MTSLLSPPISPFHCYILVVLVSDEEESGTHHKDLGSVAFCMKPRVVSLSKFVIKLHIKEGEMEHERSLRRDERGVRREK